MIEAQCASILVPHDHLHINQIPTSAERRTRPCTYRHTDRPVRHDTGWLPWRLIRLPTIGRISRAIPSSRPPPPVTRAGITASRPEPPWRASRRQPGEMDGIGAVDPDPEANTLDRYQSGHQSTLGYLTHQRAGPLPGRVGNWFASPHWNAAGLLAPGACGLLQRPPCCRADAARPTRCRWPDMTRESLITRRLRRSRASGPPAPARGAP